MPLIACEVDVCLTAFAGSRGIDLTSFDATDAVDKSADGSVDCEKISTDSNRCCFAAGLGNSCHLCQDFELPAEIRFGNRWICDDYCIEPTSGIFFSSLLFAVVLCAVLLITSYGIYWLRRHSIQGHLIKLMPEPGLSGAIVRGYSALRRSPFYFGIQFFCASFPGVILSMMRLDSKHVPPWSGKFETITTSIIAFDLAFSLTFRSVRGEIGLSKIPGVFICCLLISSPVTLTYFSDSRTLKTWYSFGFLGAYRAYEIARNFLGFSERTWQAKVVKILITVHISMFLLLGLEAALASPGESIVRSLGPWRFQDSAFMLTLASLSQTQKNLFPLTMSSRIIFMIWILYSLSIALDVFRAIVVPLTLQKIQKPVPEQFKKVLLFLGLEEVDSTYFLESEKTLKSPLRPERLPGQLFYIITGDPSAEAILEVVSEIFHPEHLQADRVTVACVLSRPEVLFRLWKWRAIHPDFIQRLLLRHGNLIDPIDAKRYSVSKADSVLIISSASVCNLDADAKTVATFCSLRKVCRVGCAFVVSVRAAESKNAIERMVSRSETVTVEAEESLKFRVLARACIAPCFVPFLGNLCRSISSGAALNANWLAEYEHGLGMEVYRIPLSSEYNGRKFSDVSEDVYLRSEPHPVLLIGIVECDLNQEHVRVHPGHDYRISRVWKSHGIFIAADVDKIQQESEVRKRGVEESIPGSTMTSEMTSANRFWLEDSGVLPGQVKEDPKQNLRIGSPQDASWAGKLHVFLNLVRLGALTTFQAAETLGVSELDVREGLIHIDLLSGPNSRKFRKSVKEKGPIVRRGRPPSEAARRQKEIDDINDAAQVIVPIESLQLTGHILILLPGNMNDAEKLSLGLEYFYTELPSERIVLVANAKPSDWPQAAARGLIHFLGDPQDLSVLRRAAVVDAKSVLVLAGELQDLSAIVLGSQIDIIVPCTTHIIVQVRNEAGLSFVPLPRTAAALKSKENRGISQVKRMPFDALRCPSYVSGRLYYDSMLNKLSACLLFNPSLRVVIDQMRLETILITSKGRGRSYGKTHLELLRSKGLIGLYVKRSYSKEANRVIPRGGFFDSRTALEKLRQDTFDLERNPKLRKAIQGFLWFIGLPTCKTEVEALEKPTDYFVTAPPKDLILREGDMIVCLRS